MSSSGKNKRKHSAIAPSSGGREGALPKNSPHVRFQIEEAPVSNRFVVPSGFAPVDKPCIVNPADVAAGREELWLIQLPSTSAMQALVAAGSLELDLAARRPAVSGRAGRASESVAAAVAATFRDPDGTSYKLVMDATDQAAQLVAVCPVHDTEGSAEAAPILRRLTVAREVPPALVGSTAGEPEDEAAAFARLEASLVAMATARREAAEVAAAEGGVLMPALDDPMVVAMEVDEQAVGPSATAAGAPAAAGGLSGEAGRTVAGDKDGKERHRHKDKDKKEKEKRKGREGEEGKKKDKERDKEKDKDKDKGKSKRGETSKTPAAPAPAVAAAAVKDAPATAPPAMRQLDAATATATPVPVPISTTPVVLQAPAQAPAAAPASVDGDKKKEKEKKEKEKKEKEKKEKEKKEKSKGKDKGRKGDEVKTPAAVPTAPVVIVKEAPATAPPAMRPLGAATAPAAAGADGVGKHEDQDKAKKDKHKDKKQDKEKDKRDKRDKRDKKKHKKEKKEKKKNKDKENGKDKDKESGSSGSDSD